jgi:hypothetical protein
MSLQKIQVELEIIKSMSTDEGQILSKKVWDGFKNWRNEPVEIRTKKPKAVKKLETLEDKPLPRKDESNRPLLVADEESFGLELVANSIQPMKPDVPRSSLKEDITSIRGEEEP